VEKLTFSDTVEKIPNIGPKYKNLLKKLGITSVKDFLFHFPSRYIDFSNLKTTKEVSLNDNVTLVGGIKEAKLIFTKSGKKITRGTFYDDFGELYLIWFYQPYIMRTLRDGGQFSVSGQITIYDKKRAIFNPTIEPFEEGGEGRLHTGRLVPVYPETSGLTSKWLRSRMSHLLKNSNLTEYLSESVKTKHALLKLDSALNIIHFPDTEQEVEKAKERFKFEELFNLLLQTTERKTKWQKNKPVKVFEEQEEKIKVFRESLPFTLTKSQQDSTSEILTDLVKDIPMNRLLQGDVGSGKTIVAVFASYFAFLNGCKTYFLAPTEILAKQHFQTIKTFLEPLGVKVGLVTGSVKDKGDFDIKVGTHALLLNEFDPDLGLIVIDEQHKFGVKQRAALLAQTSKTRPHVLTMSATPIPRSLAMTLIGDLDCSFLTDIPGSRRKVTTWVVPNEKKDKAYEWIKNEIEKSGKKSQAFVVCPLIEESESESLKNIKSALDEHKRLSSTTFKKLKTDVLHGKMKNKEKTEIIDNFRNGKTSILFSTPVIEVGIDVPTATIIVIEGADRFGLASLHQIRGRVGRNNEKCYCMLFTESDDPAVYSRLKNMETKHNGFELAEMDLQLRGPGDILGLVQHGDMKLDLVTVQDLLNPGYINKIKETAKEVVETNPETLGELYKHLKGS